MHDDRHRKNTYASSTTVTDGELVDATSSRPGHAYDFDGKPVWKASLGNIAKAGMGPGTSPVLFENLIILRPTRRWGPAAIVVLDQPTAGSVESRTHHAPQLGDAAAREGGRSTELIAAGAEMVVADDRKTGKELWRVQGVRSHPIPSAVAGHGMVYLTAGSGAKLAMAMRPGQNGDLTGTDKVAGATTRAPRTCRRRFSSASTST